MTLFPTEPCPSCGGTATLANRFGLNAERVSIRCDVCTGGRVRSDKPTPILVFDPTVVVHE